MAKLTSSSLKQLHVTEQCIESTLKLSYSLHCHLFKPVVCNRIEKCTCRHTNNNTTAFSWVLDGVVFGRWFCHWTYQMICPMANLANCLHLTHWLRDCVCSRAAYRNRCLNLITLHYNVFIKEILSLIKLQLIQCFRLIQIQVLICILKYSLTTISLKLYVNESGHTGCTVWFWFTKNN